MKKPGKVERNVGDVDKALASAAKVITGEYYAPHIHHATMEPPGRDRAHERRQVGGVGAGAEPRRRARRHRRRARHQARRR